MNRQEIAVIAGFAALVAGIVGACWSCSYTPPNADALSSKVCVGQ